MTSLVDITIPVFGIGMLGYIAMRLGWFSAQAGQLKQSITAVLAKNIAFPVCVYLTCTHIFALSAHWTFIAVLMAAQPTGMNAYIFAERYGSSQALATTTVFLSTAFSMLTISVLLYLYNPGAF